MLNIFRANLNYDDTFRVLRKNKKLSSCRKKITYILRHYLEIPIERKRQAMRRIAMASCFGNVMSACKISEKQSKRLIKCEYIWRVVVDWLICIATPIASSLYIVPTLLEKRISIYVSVFSITFIWRISNHFLFINVRL